MQIELIRRQIQFKVAACPHIHSTLKLSNFQWTGSQVEFVELGYSLLDAKSINNGTITLKELFAALGDFFNFRVTDYYRFFSDITHRTGDRTLYLDKLKKAFMQHLSESDNR